VSRARHGKAEAPNTTELPKARRANDPHGSGRAAKPAATGHGGWRRLLPFLAIAVLVAGIAFPLYWTIVSSLTPESRLFATPQLVPDVLVLDHYRALFDERDFWVPIRNSLIVAGTTTLLSVVVGSIAAYALARLRFRGKALVLSFILAVSMFPQISIVSPLYIVLRELRLINTYPGLVLPYLTFAMPLTIWLLVGYFRQLPAELEEAGMIDGAGRLRIFREIILPLALPGVATTAILTFLYSWNEFLFALSFTLGPERYTVPVAIALFRGQYQVPWGQILAAAVVATIPVALLVLLFQRRIVQGLTAGAVKG
jgi:ABC-type glycerol-3-phosphate transport system permease component